MIGKRSEKIVREELERTQIRLELYLSREQEMLDSRGVQSYSIGSRNLQRYQTPLTAIQDEIERLRKRKAELEAELSGKTVRRAVGVVPRDW